MDKLVQDLGLDMDNPAFEFPLLIVGLQAYTLLSIAMTVGGFWSFGYFAMLYVPKNDEHLGIWSQDIWVLVIWIAYEVVVILNLIPGAIVGIPTIIVSAISAILMIAGLLVLDVVLPWPFNFIPQVFTVLIFIFLSFGQPLSPLFW